MHVYKGFSLSAFGAVILISGCAEQSPQAELSDNTSQTDLSDFDSPTLPPTSQGDPVPVPSDPKASYRLLRSSKMANGNLEVVTRRDGPSGTSFARREIDCNAMTFRYLGEGDTQEELTKDGYNVGEMGELTEGSISTEVSNYACRKARV